MTVTQLAFAKGWVSPKILHHISGSQRSLLMACTPTGDPGGAATYAHPSPPMTHEGSMNWPEVDTGELFPIAA